MKYSSMTAKEATPFQIADGFTFTPCLSLLLLHLLLFALLTSGLLRSVAANGSRSRPVCYVQTILGLPRHFIFPSQLVVTGSRLSD